VLRFVLLLSCFHFSLCLLAQTHECDLKKDKDGVKVYTCKSDTSKFHSLKAEFVIENTSIAELKSFLFTVPNYLKWQYNVMESSMLKKISNEEMVYRVMIHAPWPLANREMIVQFSAVLQDENHANFYINTIASDYPKNDDLVRVPFSQASWTITRKNNSLHCLYQMNIDPGGYIPPVLVNVAMADGPLQSFRNLKGLIEKK
jgi:hypothetical protein